MWFRSLLASWKSGLSRRPQQRLALPRNCRLRLEALEDRCVPATLNVTSHLDNGASGTLRWAVGIADASATPDTIHIQTTQTIVLTHGQLLLSANMTVDSPGSKATISGNNASRIFDISGSASVTIAGLTLTDGLAATGGAILLDGSAALSLSNCTLTDNKALGTAIVGGSGYGGGIEDNSTGALAVTNSTFDSNKAVGIGTNSLGTGPYILALGGAIDVSYASTSPATISNSTFTGNQALGGSPGASAGGGALSNSSNFGAAMTVTGCTLSGNSAIGDPGGDGTTNYGSGQGGGINDFGSLSVRDSSLSNNLALGTTLAVVSQTVLGNSGTAGGGIFCLTPFFPSTVVVSDSTLCGNQAVGGAGGAGSAGNVGEGGGLALILVGPSVGGPSAVVDGCTFADNVAQGGAGGSGAVGAPGASGGIDVAVTSSAIVSNTTLIHNQAIGGAGGAAAKGGDGVGGGIDVGTGVLLFGPGSDGSSLTLTNSILIDNQALGGAGGAGSIGGNGLGGGFSVLGGSSASSSSSIVTFNVAQGGAGGLGGNGGSGLGGGVYVFGVATTTASIDDTLIVFNDAVGGLPGRGGASGQGVGGGLYIGSGAAVSLSPSSEVFFDFASTSANDIFGTYT